MKKIFLPLSILLFVSCNQNNEPKPVVLTKDSAVKLVEAVALKDVPKREDLLKQIADLEKELYSTEQLNLEKAKKMISLSLRPKINTMIIKKNGRK